MITRTRSSESSASSSSSNVCGVISECLDLAETAWIRPTTTGKSSLDDSTVFKELIMDRLVWNGNRPASNAMIQKSLRRPRNWNRPGPSAQGRKPRDGRWPRENELTSHLRSSVDRFAELQFFLRFCQARSARTVPRLHGRNGLADMPVAR